MEEIYCLNGIGSPCLTQNAWAAWVQAVGSILAILVAVGIAWWQRSHERTEAALDRERIAKRTAIHLLPFVQDIGRILVSINNREALDQVAVDARVLGPIAISLLDHQGVHAIASSLDRLGDAEIPAQDVVYNIHRARELVEGNKADGYTVRSPRKFYERMRAATTAVTAFLDTADRMVMGHVGD